MKKSAYVFFASILLLSFSCQTKVALNQNPIRLHPENPNYFICNGKLIVLFNLGEHYGAVMNSDFDYEKYLSTELD